MQRCSFSFCGTGFLVLASAPSSTFWEAAVNCLHSCASDVVRILFALCYPAASYRRSDVSVRVCRNRFLCVPESLFQLRHGEVFLALLCLKKVVAYDRHLLWDFCRLTCEQILADGIASNCRCRSGTRPRTTLTPVGYWSDLPPDSTKRVIRFASSSPTSLSRDNPGPVSLI